MIQYDSHEVEQLRKMIDGKESYLKKLQTAGNKAASQMLEEEIVFLKLHVLPVLQRSTQLVHHEFAKHAVRVFDAALQSGCNGLLLYQTIEKQYIHQPNVGVYSDSSLNKFGTLGAVELICMDRTGASINPIPLQL